MKDRLQLLGKCAKGWLNIFNQRNHFRPTEIERVSVPENMAELEIGFKAIREGTGDECLTGSGWCGCAVQQFDMSIISRGQSSCACEREALKGVFNSVVESVQHGRNRRDFNHAWGGGINADGGRTDLGDEPCKLF